MLRRFLAAIAIGFGLVSTGAAMADTSRIDDEFVSSTLVPEHLQLTPGQTTRLALDMEIAPGWHTYWINAGDSGEAVSIDWTLPEGVKVGEVSWPAPHRQPYPPLMNYGYSDRSTLVMDLSVPRGWPEGEPVQIEAGLFWLVCAEVCIPGEGSVSLSLPTGPTSQPNPAAPPVFASAEMSQPVANPYPARFQVKGDEIRLRLSSADIGGNAIKDAYFFSREWGVVEHSAPQLVSRDSTGLTLVAKISTETDEPFDGEQLEGVIELVSTEEGGPDRMVLNVAAERGVVTSGIAGYQGAAAGGSTSFPMAVLFAFLGGIILNLMPCVFPVLALKAIGFAGSAHGSAGERISHGVAYTAGVLVLFMVLAVGLIVLKGAGEAVGWGFQLQNPVVVAFLAYVMFLVGLNLSGVFDINTGLEGAGEGAAQSGGSRGAFFTGALAAIVATPCSAPFMAAALGAALTMSVPATLMVFAALGFGLAFPFLLLSLSPQVARLMPKPGPWMVRLKEVLAFPMYATAAWLVWVLGSLSGQDAMLMAMIGGVLLGFAVWMFGIAQESTSTRGQIFGRLGAAVAVGLVVFYATGFETRSGPVGGVNAAAGSELGEPFSTARLAQLRAEGKPVFINMTADWCITCKVNERVAFGEGFKRALEENDVTYLKGDWTARDPEITALLQEFGRVGVPLYAIYPREGKPELLPQIITPSMMVERLGAV